MKVDHKPEKFIENWVVDSSFTVPLFLPDEYSSQIEGFFNVALQRGTTIFVSAIWWFEINNVLHLSIKRKRLNYQQAMNAIEICKYFDFFKIEPVVFNHVIVDLAQSHNLSAYDASYLDLAVRYQAGLATLDKQLTTVAKQLGLEVWFWWR